MTGRLALLSDDDLMVIFTVAMWLLLWQQIDGEQTVALPVAA